MHICRYDSALTQALELTAESLQMLDPLTPPVGFEVVLLWCSCWTRLAAGHLLTNFKPDRTFRTSVWRWLAGSFCTVSTLPVFFPAASLFSSRLSASAASTLQPFRCFLFVWVCVRVFSWIFSSCRRKGFSSHLLSDEAFSRLLWSVWINLLHMQRLECEEAFRDEQL